MALDRFAGYGKASQKLQLFPTMMERSIAAYHRHHAPYRGRVFGIHDIQLPITRGLTLMATRTIVIRAVEGHRSHRREQLPRADGVKRGVVSTTTRQGSGKGFLLIEQVRHHSRTGAMYGGARSSLDCLQVHAAGLPQTREDDLQQSLYLAGNFFLDGFDRFFS